ncbi:MAG: HNH endonuclease [Deltaproteobacteria bacterium]|nr:HNH endonuclease [Deltaproteobacteria bacterium]
MNNLTFQLDNKAKTLAGDYLRTEAELLCVLMEMRRRRIFLELNCSGIFEYCERILKLSKAQSYYFKSVAETAEKVPELKQAVTQGELSLSQARRIAPILTAENQKQWIEKAKTLPQTALEKEVAAVNPSAHPKEKIKPVAKKLSELKVPIDDETESNLLALKDILSQKLGRNATLCDVIAFAAKVTREKFDPIEKAKRAKQISSGNEVSPGAGGTIVAAVKHEVVRRDDNQCTYVGSDGKRCNQRKWLHYHHRTPVAKGGTSTVDNLQILCSMHHAAHHDGRITLNA